MKNGLKNTYCYSSTFLVEENYPFFIRLKSTQTSADVSSLLGNGDINPKGKVPLKGHGQIYFSHEAKYMTLLLGSKSSALLPRASPGSTTASQVGLTNTGVKCATCGWMDGCTCGAMWLDVHWERDEGPLYFHSSSLKKGQ